MLRLSRLIPLLLAAQSVLADQIDWSADLCGLQKQFFATVSSKPMSFDDVAKDFAASGASVALMGESHSEGNGPFYADFLSSLKRADQTLDCVTFEIDRRFFAQGFVRPRWELLAARAKELGVRVFKIDRCIKSADQSGQLWCPDGRNAGMANKIYVLLNRGICHRILHTGGLDHLQNMRPAAPPNLSERLAAKNLKAYRIAVVDTTLTANTAAAGLSAWNWGRVDTRRLVCAEQNLPAATNFAFLTRATELAARIPVLYWTAPYAGQPWSDYDAALVLGCENEPSRCAAKNLGR